MIATYGFAGLAGMLSVLSPCVLPIVPILLASAATQHRLGPLALAGGLTLSFAVIGTMIASLGSAFDLDPALVRMVSAIALGLVGITLLSASLQQRFAVAASGLSNAGQVMMSRMNLDGLTGQFVIGLILGGVWSPCVGPTLGAAVTLASRAANLPQVALTMTIFGLGAALPILVLGALSRGVVARNRGRLLQAGSYGKIFLGLSLLLVSIAMLTGADKSAEVYLVDHSPAWLTALTTRY